MPRYEYSCKDCGKVFEAILSLKEHDEKRTACPNCKSDKVEQKPAAFQVQTSKKS